MHRALTLWGRHSLPRNGSAPANPAQSIERFAAFNMALGGFADALDGAEADEVQVAGRGAFCRDQVPNPLADLM